MSDTDERTGRCLCGAVQFTATLKKPQFGACHCRMCRRWASGPFVAIECQPVVFNDETHVRRYTSSDWAERGFCDRCGSTLFYRLIDSGRHGMAAGLFDDQTGLTFTHQLFIDKKPEYYAFSNQTEELTEAQIFEMHVPAGIEPLPDEPK